MEVELRRRDGSVRALALIDDEDYPTIAGMRWKLSVPGGYAASTTGGELGRVTYMHRLLMGLTPGDGLTVDHINRNRLDNRRVNLRVVTAAENYQNVAAKPGTTSEFRGVYWDKAKGKWRASVGLRGKNYILGVFDVEEEAACAAAAFRETHMPFAMS